MGNSDIRTGAKGDAELDVDELLGDEDSDVTDDLGVTGESALALLDNGEAIFDLKPSF